MPGGIHRVVVSNAPVTAIVAYDLQFYKHLPDGDLRQRDDGNLRQATRHFSFISLAIRHPAVIKCHRLNCEPMLAPWFY
jgi:hypothetical protein